MIQVRRTQPKDLEYILSSSSALGFKSEAMIHHLGDMMLVIENHQILGIGFFKNYRNLCILNWIHIVEGHRRQKLGTMLTKTMLSTAEQQGATSAFIHTDCNGFAASLGFDEIIAAEEAEEIADLYEALYKENASFRLYKASLIDYFKPCCHS